MTNPMFYPQPNYSGVTIQIANPNMDVTNGNCSIPRRNGQPNGFCQNQPYYCPLYNNGYGYINPNTPQNSVSDTSPNTLNEQEIPISNPIAQPQVQQGYPQTNYPPQYYLNNYNYQNNGVDNNKNKLPNIDQNGTPTVRNFVNGKEIDPNSKQFIDDEQNKETSNPIPYNLDQYRVDPEAEGPQDFSKSQAVIEELDSRNQAAKDAKKNSKEKRVVALTDEYIKSLENYLNNPNDEIRLMASKEILTRLDEDKDRYDDLALNALLNKMLQDPSKLIRVAALSAFGSQLASGNDYTIQLLHNIQQNPNADKEDVLQAADILLKMSGGTEIKQIPNPVVKENNENKEKK